MVIKIHMHKCVTPGAPSCFPQGRHPLPSIVTSSLPHRPTLCLRHPSLRATGHCSPPRLALPLWRRARVALQAIHQECCLLGSVGRVGGESMAQQSPTSPKIAPWEPKHAAFCRACTDTQSCPHRDSSGTANPLCITRDSLWLRNKQLSLILLLIITAIGMAFVSDVWPEHQAV